VVYPIWYIPRPHIFTTKGLLLVALFSYQSVLQLIWLFTYNLTVFPSYLCHTFWPINRSKQWQCFISMPTIRQSVLHIWGTHFENKRATISGAILLSVCSSVCLTVYLFAFNICCTFWPQNIQQCCLLVWLSVSVSISLLMRLSVLHTWATHFQNYQ